MADKAESKGKAAISMAPTESSSSTSSSSSSSSFKYHAFLSFRGADVRYGFADWLYTELVAAGLYTFRDCDDIGKGTEFEPEIDKAIRESKVAVIIFSEDFASSTYCLDEVAMFMEEKQAKVLPVFLNVDPDHVGSVEGTYGDSFKRHEEKLESLRGRGEELEEWRRKLARWRNALRQVAQITCRHVYENGYQSELIRGVVDDARRLANLVKLDIPSHVVGKPYRFVQLRSWVKNGSPGDERIALVHGGHGIGKKTVAKVVFNQMYRDFDATAFFERVAEMSETSDGIVKLQIQLLSRLSESKRSSKITSELEGIAAIKEGLMHKRVLIVLADLDRSDQFFKLIPSPECLEQGSKVIVTSVNEKLLQGHLCVKFPVVPLIPSHSLELLSWHAFGTPRPVDGREKSVMAALRYCSGSPSALEKFGSLLSSGMDCWHGLVPATLEDPKLKSDMEASFGSLKKDDKKLFLDIACFYAGMDFDHVDSVLKSCNLYTKGGFDRLRSKHLVSVDDQNNSVTMDPSTVDMGREIVREKTKYMEEFSNIWFTEDAIELLRECNGTKHIRSFILDEGEKAHTNSTSETEFRAEAFAGMTKLKLLKLVNRELEGDFDDFPKGLVWLSWNAMSLIRLPDDISLKDLVVLDLSNSGLQELWNETRSLDKLKILNLSVTFVTKTPDFTRLRVPSLERLILDACIHLEEIDPSIAVLESLVQLSLQCCRSLAELTVLGSPVKLDLSGCEGLRAMPKEMIQSVKELNVNGTVIDQFWSEPPSFSLSAVFPCLVKLSLQGCSLSDGEIIRDLAELRSLEYLNLSYNLFTSIPEALGAFLSLRTLLLNKCERLEVIGALPNRLEMLYLLHCKSLEKINGVVRPAMHMFAEGCANLVQVGEASRSEAMRSEDIKMMNDLRLYNWESSATSYYEIEMVSTYTGSIKETLVQEQQVQFHCGTFNFFVRGSAIPAWYDHQTGGETILVDHVQPEPGRSIVGINLCVVYKTRGQYTTYPFHVTLTLSDLHSKTLYWGYNPVAYATANEEHTMWFSHWKLKGHIEPDDAVMINVRPLSDDVEVTKFGICLPSEDGAEKPISSSSWYQKLDVDLSTYEESPRVFNISSKRHRSMVRVGYQYGGQSFETAPEEVILF